MFTINRNSNFPKSKFCICVRIYSRISAFRRGLFASRGTARSRLELEPPGSSSQETQPETETLGSATLKHTHKRSGRNTREKLKHTAQRWTNKQTNKQKSETADKQETSKLQSDSGRGKSIDYRKERKPAWDGCGCWC